MFYPIVITIVLFFFALGLRAVFKNLCAICLAFAGTWVILLVADLFWQTATNPLILGIYMGGSVVGFMYYLSSKLPEKFYVFKLPFLISAIYLSYSFFSSNLEQGIILLLIFLWAAFLLIFSFRNFPRFKNFSKKIIECCRNW